MFKLATRTKFINKILKANPGKTFLDMRKTRALKGLYLNNSVDRTVALPIMTKSISGEYVDTRKIIYSLIPEATIKKLEGTEYATWPYEGRIQHITPETEVYKKIFSGTIDANDYRHIELPDYIKGKPLSLADRTIHTPGFRDIDKNHIYDIDLNTGKTVGKLDDNVGYRSTANDDGQFTASMHKYITGKPQDPYENTGFLYVSPHKGIAAAYLQPYSLTSVHRRPNIVKVDLTKINKVGLPTKHLADPRTIELSREEIDKLPVYAATNPILGNNPNYERVTKPTSFQEYFSASSIIRSNKNGILEDKAVDIKNPIDKLQAIGRDGNLSRIIQAHKYYDPVTKKYRYRSSWLENLK